MIRSFLHTMENGLRVVCVEMPHLHSAELAVFLKVGGRNDPHGREGLSHVLEHILFRGTADFSSSLDIEAAFEDIGGAPNAATDAESTCYYSRVHPDHVARGMEIFASMLMRPAFNGVDIEKRIIAEEAREDLNEEEIETNPDTIVSRLLWPRHPLGMPTIGTLDSIAATTLDDLQRHHAAYYVPSNTVLAVSGPLRSHEVFAAARSAFGDWKEGSTPGSRLFVQSSAGRPVLKLVQDSDSQMGLQIAFLGLHRGDPRHMEVRLLRRILAGGGSSRLHLLLRETLGIIYSVEGAIGAYDETGCIAFDLSTAPETLAQAVEGVLGELKRIAAEPVPADELERVRRSYIYDLEYSRDSAYDMTGRYGWGELMGFVRSIEDDCRAAADVTAEGLQATARLLFEPGNLRLVAVGPWKRGMKRQVQDLVNGYSSSFTVRKHGI